MEAAAAIGIDREINWARGIGCGSQGFSGAARRTDPGWVISESDGAPNPGLRDPNSGRECVTST